MDIFAEMFIANYYSGDWVGFRCDSQICSNVLVGFMHHMPVGQLCFCFNTYLIICGVLCFTWEKDPGHICYATIYVGIYHMQVGPDKPACEHLNYSSIHEIVTWHRGWVGSATGRGENNSD